MTSLLKLGPRVLHSHGNERMWDVISSAVTEKDGTVTRNFHCTKCFREFSSVDIENAPTMRVPLPDFKAD